MSEVKSDYLKPGHGLQAAQKVWCDLKHDCMITQALADPIIARASASVWQDAGLWDESLQTAPSCQRFIARCS